MATENKFKVGQWVRRVTASHSPLQYGEMGGIYRVLDENVCGIVVIAGSGAASKGAFEPWTPRVGERVRCILGTAIVDEGKVYQIVTAPRAPSGNNLFFVDTGEHGALDYNADYFEPVIGTTARTESPIVTAATVDAINEEYGPVVREAPVAGPKFKVGDVAEVVRSRPGLTSKVGRRITISRVTSHALYARCDGVDNMVFHEDELELAGPTTPTTPAIVALITDGKPQPATKPKVHDSQELATKEAERLALANPGQQFGVFVLADSKIADEVVTKTAVLRAA